MDIIIASVSIGVALIALAREAVAFVRSGNAGMDL